MKKILLLSLYLWLPAFMFAQTEKLGLQVQKNLALNEPGIDECTLNLKIADFYFSKNPDSAFFYYSKALEKNDSKKLKDSIAVKLNKLGFKYSEDSNYEQAIKSYLKANTTFIELNNSEEIAKTYRSLAYCYTQLYDEKEAMNYNVKSLNKFKEIGNKDGMADNFNDIGNLYYNQENYSIANTYYKNALDIYTKLGDKIGKALCLTNLGNSISDSGNLEEGLDYYFKSLNILKDSKDELHIATNYNNIGDSYSKMGLFSDAEDYFQRSLAIAKTKNDNALQAIAYMNLAEVNNKELHYEKAIDYASKSLFFSKKLGDLSYQLEDFKFLGISYEGLRDYKTALNYSKKYAKVSDSLINRDQIKKVQLMGVVKELNDNEAKMAQLASSNKIVNVKYESGQKLLSFFIVGFILVTFLGILLFLLQSRKQKAYKLLEFKNFQINKMNEEIELQRDYLAQMNETKDKLFSIIGHDLKNPFNSIKGFSELMIENSDDFDEKKKVRFLKIIKGAAVKATNLLDNLLVWARSQSDSLSFSLEKLELKEAITNVISLIEIQAANKEIQIVNDISNSYFVSADKNMLQAIFRNLISNAIKFTENGGKIYLTAVTNENFVEISVRDTGVGMTKFQLKNLFKNNLNNSNLGTANEEGTGLGLILCKDFVEKLGGIILAKSTLEHGSEFIFTIPLWVPDLSESINNELLKFLN